MSASGRDLSDTGQLLADVASALDSFGLSIRGGVQHVDLNGPPFGAGHSPSKSVLLIGNIGGAFWPHFKAWRGSRPGDIANPLDAWSREVIDGVASAAGARAVYPSDKPYWPFQQWAMRAEGLRPSPLGILMHPEYGLWHAYRGALLFGENLDFPMSSSRHPCDVCETKPCKRACPVKAHAGLGFEYEDCLGALRSASESICMNSGCLDRNACPYGQAYRYPRETQAFLMSAFAR